MALLLAVPLRNSALDISAALHGIAFGAVCAAVIGAVGSCGAYCMITGKVMASSGAGGHVLGSLGMV